MTTSTVRKLDANEQAFFFRQIEHIQVKQREVQHKPLRAAEFIPVNMEAPAGTDKITYRFYDVVGLAKFISDYATDVPDVDAYGTETSVNVKSIGVGYKYSIKEIRRAAQGGVPLDQRRASAAKRAINEKLDTVAWLGDTKQGINGLLKYPGILSYTLLADGTGSSKLWSTKTPDQIVRDIAGLLTAVNVATNSVEECDTLIMTRTAYNYLSFTRMGSGSDKTILTYVRENFPMLTKISWVNELVGIGAGSTDRIMAYKRDPDKLDFQLPVPFESFDPEKKGMVYKVMCHAETAGVIVYYPLSVVFADGL